MADKNDFLLFTEFLTRYINKKERTFHVRANPYDDYDDEEFRQRFRLSKTTVAKLLEEVIIPTVVAVFFVQ